MVMARGTGTAGESRGAARPYTRSGAAKATAIWGCLNAVMALVILGFGGETMAFRFEMYGAGVLLVGLVAVLLTFPRYNKQVPIKGSLPSGAPSAALALACLFAALAWAFSVWLAYLALPPVLFALSRLWGEHRERKAERALTRTGPREPL